MCLWSNFRASAKALNQATLCTRTRHGCLSTSDERTKIAQPHLPGDKIRVVSDPGGSPPISEPDKRGGDTHPPQTQVSWRPQRRGRRTGMAAGDRCRLAGDIEKQGGIWVKDPPTDGKTMKIDDILSATRVLPLLVIRDIAKAVPLAEALVAGGLKTMQVTLRTPAALDAVRAIAMHVPEVTVGVGTLVRPEQFVQAQDAGARFAISPGLTQVLINASEQSSLPYLPGVFTPSEVMAARDMGFDHLKLYPATQAGGIGMLKALGELFPELKYCPIGGITGDSLPAYLELDNVVCVGGSWVAPPNLIEQEDWSTITALAAAANAVG